MKSPTSPATHAAFTLAALLLLATLPLACSKKEASGGAKPSDKSSSSGKSSGSQDSQQGADNQSGASAGKSKGGGSKGGSDSKGGSNSKGANAQQDKDTVTLTPEQQQLAGIRIAEVDVQPVARSIDVAGQVVMDEQHTAHIGAIADGRITGVYVLPGANVRRGQTLADLHSHTVHETVGALFQAFADVDRQHGAVAFAQGARDRYQHLYSIQAASLEESQHANQQLIQAQTDLAAAEATVHMEREHLSELLQVNPESLNRSNLYNRELVPVRSVIDGTVITRDVTPGQVVQTGMDTFIVSNLSTVWITAALNEADIALVRIGASARVTTQAYPGQNFAGRVGLVGDTLDPATRTIPVRIVVPNPGIKLRPQMFATVSIAQPETRPAVFAPEDALQDVNGLQAAFVTADGKTFHAQAVQIGTRAGHRVEITQGLKPGDHIAVAGAFMIKSELLKGSMGED